jgi:flagellar biosynthesis/type III secretory pathway protein FliH
MTDDELLDCKVKLAKNLLSRKLPIQKRRYMLRFLKYYVRFQQKETNYRFDSIIHNLTNKKYNMNIEEFMIDRAKKEGIAEGIEQGVEKGIEKGIQKGRKKGIREGQRKKTHSVVTSLLLNTRFNTTRIAKLVDVPETFVQKVKTSLN